MCFLAQHSFFCQEGHEKVIIRVLLASIKGESAEVVWWNSTNGGKNFTKEDVYLNKEGGGFSMSHFIRNAHPDARIIATQRIQGTNYSNVYLLGDNGAVKRLKTEADVLKNHSK